MFYNTPDVLCLGINADAEPCVFRSRSILSRDGVLYVKLRAGQLPYKDDPRGWKSLLAASVNNRNPEVRTFKVCQCGWFKKKKKKRRKCQIKVQTIQQTCLSGTLEIFTVVLGPL